VLSPNIGRTRDFIYIHSPLLAIAIIIELLSDSLFLAGSEAFGHRIFLFGGFFFPVYVIGDALFFEV